MKSPMGVGLSDAHREIGEFREKDYLPDLPDLPVKVASNPASYLTLPTSSQDRAAAGQAVRR